MSEKKLFGKAIKDVRDTTAKEIRFITAAETRNLFDIVTCLAEGVDPNTMVKGTSALHIAAERSDIYLMLKLTAVKTCNINIQTAFGNTPLYIACYKRGAPKFVKALLKMGADPNLANKMGNTPLHAAAKVNTISIAMLLLKNKANPNSMNTFCDTPLSIAVVDKRFLPMVKLLIRYGADPNLAHPLVMPLFLRACLSCTSETDLRIIDFLVKSGIDTKVRDPISKKNALHYAAGTGNIALATYLLRKRLAINIEDGAGRTPLMIAKLYENTKMVALIEDYQIYIEYLKEHGYPTKKN